MKNKLIAALFLIICLMPIQSLYSRVIQCLEPSKTYTKKPVFSGLGKVSKTNRKIRTKPVRGYFKPKRGFKFVNPYLRS